MDDSGHADAARRYADRASGQGGHQDPAVQAALAQAEALLAVAAAIGHLAAVLDERTAPLVSPPDGRVYQVAEVRRQHPNAYGPWTADDDAALLAAHQAGHDITALAGTFGRQPSAIRSRLSHLAGLPPSGTVNAPPPG